MMYHLPSRNFLRRKTTWLFGAMLLATIITRCSIPTQSAGSGVEIGNSSITGVALSADGKTRAGIQVSLFSSAYLDGVNEPANIRKDTKTDQNGVYTFDSLPRGLFNIIVRTEIADSAFLASQLIPVDDGSLRTVNPDTLEPVSTITGTVTLERGGSAAGLKLYLRGTDYSTVTSASGAFRFSHVPAGSHILLCDVMKLGYDAPHVFQVSVPADTVLNLTLSIADFKGLQLTGFTPGQTWSYHSLWNVSDTSIGNIDAWTNHFYVGDTIITGKTFHKIKTVQRCMAQGNLMVSNDTGFDFIHLGQDSVEVLDPDELIFGVFKSRRTTSYDTSAFDDQIFPLVLSVKPGKTWYYRPEGDPRGSGSLIAEFVGNERITVPGGTFNCRRIEWFWLWSVNDTIRVTDWVAECGTVARTVEHIRATGVKEDWIHQEYCGPGPLPLDSLAPVVPDSLLDSVKAVINREWSVERFSAWLARFRRNDTIPIAVHPNDAHWYGIFGDKTPGWKQGYSRYDSLRTKYSWVTKQTTYFVWYNGSLISPDFTAYVSDDTLLLTDSIISSFYLRDCKWLLFSADRTTETKDFFRLFVRDAYGFPPRLSDFYEKSYALRLVFSSNQLEQGWSDCDWDSEARGPWNPADSSAPFGRSKIHEKVREMLKDYRPGQYENFF